MSTGPSIWELTSEVLFPRSLDLAAIDKISGCELKIQIWSFNVAAKALARNKSNYLVWVSCILFKLFGTPFICHQWGSLLDVEMCPTQEKGSHLPPGTTKHGNLRDSHDPSQLPLLNQILGFFSSVFHWQPTQGCQKCDRVHRDARWIGELSTQNSHLSHQCNPLQKVVIHALLDTRFKGM